MQHEDVTAVVWKDKRVVLLLYTNSDPRTDGSVTRNTGKGNEEIIVVEASRSHPDTHTHTHTNTHTHTR